MMYDPDVGTVYEMNAVVLPVALSSLSATSAPAPVSNSSRGLMAVDRCAIVNTEPASNAIAMKST
jgi:hypothetical protein